jgi:ribosome-binding factor A
MASIRLHKLNELFKREIGQIIQRDLGNPKLGFATVTHAEISADLTHATVRVSVMGDDNQRRTTLAELNKAAGFIQHLLGQRVTVRSMPRLQFKLDRSLDAVYRVETLLNEIRQQDSSRTAEEPARADETGEDTSDEPADGAEP